MRPCDDLNLQGSEQWGLSPAAVWRVGCQGQGQNRKTSQRWGGSARVATVAMEKTGGAILENVRLSQQDFPMCDGTGEKEKHCDGSEPWPEGLTGTTLPSAKMQGAFAWFPARMGAPSEDDISAQQVGLTITVLLGGVISTRKGFQRSLW